MRTCSETTKADLAALGWFPHRPPRPAWVVTAFWDAMHDRPMSEKREKRLRFELGLPPLYLDLVPVTPCPSCAARGITRSHGDGLDCHGNGGTAVVLAPGDTVRRPGQQRQRQRARRPWMGVELSQAMDAAGVTDATVRWLVTRHVQELAECNAPGA